MLWLNFDTWHSGANKHFTFRRIWIKGYKWTPFIKVKLRRHRLAVKGG